jgi:hypothetical protein
MYNGSLSKVLCPWLIHQVAALVWDFVHCLGYFNTQHFRSCLHSRNPATDHHYISRLFCRFHKLCINDSDRGRTRKTLNATPVAKGDYSVLVFKILTCLLEVFVQLLNGSPTLLSGSVVIFLPSLMNNEVVIENGLLSNTYVIIIHNNIPIYSTLWNICSSFICAKCIRP